MAIEHPTDIWSNLQGRVQSAVQEHFPLEGRTNKLVLHNLYFDEKKDPHHHDIRSQEDAKNKKQTWGVPLMGEIGLVNKETGKEIDRQKVRLLTLPKTTNRYSYIIDGSERQIDNLWRLRSGVYAHVKQNGQLQAEFNLAKPFAGESRLYVPFDPQNKTFRLSYSTSSVPLYSILRMMGVSDGEMKKAWGDEIYKANSVANVKKNIHGFYDRMARRGVKASGTDYDSVATSVANEFAKTQLLPETTKHVFGKPIDHVSGEALLLASKRILDVARGDIPPDDRDSLVYKKLHSVDDFLHEKLTHNKQKRTVAQKVSNNIDRQNKVRDIFTTGLLDKPVRDFFSKSTLSRNPDQVNPLEMLTGHGTTTILGGDAGGVTNERAITNAMRLVNPSHLGFLDVIHGPESEKTGITLHLPLGAKKIGSEVKTRVYDTKKKEHVWVSPAELHSETIALPDQVKWSNGVPHPLSSQVKIKDPVTHNIEPRQFKDARYVMLSPHQLFDEATNLMPFLQNNQGNRSMTAARQQAQAVSIHDREAPLVQTQAGQKTWEGIVGQPFSHVAHVDGKVHEIKKSAHNGYPEAIVLKDKAGTKHEVQIYNHFPLNDAKTHIHSTPNVKVGDTVKKGQVISDSNFTRDGHLALGTNLRVGYLPYKGYSFEDGIVISESASKKLSSDHLHRKSMDLDPTKDLLSKAKFTAYAPTVAKAFTKEQAEKLDEHGVIRIGSRVNPGDYLATVLSKRDLTGEAGRVLGRLTKKGFGYTDKSLVWKSEHPGEVVNVIKDPRGRGVEVHVRALEPIEIGDKIVGRYGNKSVVTKILPDHEMPRIGGPDGQHIEVAMNPSGIVSRINLGQMLETAASKIAVKTGKPYVVNNFGGPGIDYTQKVRNDLAKHGLKDTETLYDPVTHKPLGDVLTGHQYILKQKHQVEKKLSVRSHSQNYNLDQAPKGTGADHPGQAIGQLEMYALLAHGARHNLREMATYKADRQLDEQQNPMAHIDFWHRVQTGQPLPAPKPTFAYRKFEGLMKGLGVDINRTGNELQLVPLTDRGVLNLSHGEIKDAGRILRGKDAKELDNGLFDPKVTGGLPDDVGKGLRWSHISLAEPLPNPIFVGTSSHAGPIPILTGLKVQEIEDIARGKKYVNGRTGGHAIQDLLRKVDVKSELEDTQKGIGGLRGTALNVANRKIKYLRALDQLGMKPHEAYVLNNLPVVPPVFRPIATLPDGSLRFDDVNHYYRSFGLVNNKLKKPVSELGDEAIQPLRRDYYDLAKGLMGLGGKPVYKSNRQLKGILDVISGDQPKTGFFQENLMKRRQELSIRSTIVPEPAMGLDNVGLPKNAAMELYKPFVVREMHRLGYAPLDAHKHMKSGSPLAWKVLEKVVEERPILMKRDPALHKYSIMAFKPKLVEGRAIQIHPLVTTGFGADFDGNCFIGTSKLVLMFRDCGAKMGSLRDVEEAYHMKFIKGTALILGRASTGLIVDTQIQHVPFLKGTGRLDKNGATVYDVPEGVSVLSYEHADNEPIFADVTAITVEEGCACSKVTTRSGYEVTASDNESLCIYDHETGDVRDMCPKDAMHRLCPVVARIPSEGVKGDFEFGWMVGTFASDGFFCGDTDIFGYAKTSNDKRDRFAAAVNSYEGKFVKRTTYREEHSVEKGDSISGSSVKDHFKGAPKTARLFRKCYLKERVPGRSCLSKRLPNLAKYSHEARLGVLLGLLEGDGSLSVSHAKKKEQVLASYSTSSRSLSRSIQRLGKFLGIRVGVTPYTPSKTSGAVNKAYILTFSIPDLEKYAEVLADRCCDKDAEAVLLHLTRTGSSKDDRDIVPVPIWVMQLCTTKSGPVGDHPTLLRSLSCAKSERKRGFYLSRRSAQQVLDVLENARGYDIDPAALNRWGSLVRAIDIHWDLVTSVEKVGNHTVYDLEVPQTKVFCVDDGLVVWDTMSGFVPMTDAAVREAHGMLPSNNLFSSTHGGVMYAPDQESLMGLHLMSKWGKPTKKSFSNFDALKKAHEAGEVDVTDVVRVAGKNTTFGRLKIGKLLPPGMSNFQNLLHNPDLTIVKKAPADSVNQLGITNLLEEVARKHRRDFTPVVDGLKDLGNNHAYDKGFSFRLADLSTPKAERDKILSRYHQEADRIHKSSAPLADRNNQLVDLWGRATTELDQHTKKLFDPDTNNMFNMVNVGARGKWSQFRQMNVAPMLMKDGRGATLPHPVTKSYSEGLDVGDYWTTLHGARMGTIQKVLSSSEPGKLSKEMINTVIPHMVVSSDCGTKSGVSMHLSDPDVHDRVLAVPVRAGGQTISAGTLLTPEHTSQMKRHKIDKVVVRSPLKCKHGLGICATCYGANEEGHLHSVGTNIGVIAGHALGEPAVNLAMKSFHTGGVAGAAGSGAMDHFTRLGQLLAAPKILPSSAVLSSHTGKVDHISRDDATRGWNIFVGGNKHYSPVSLRPQVKVGQVVKKGEPLTSGPINPHHLLGLTDIHTVQNYMTNELNDIYRSAGVKRRNIETVVRSLTNLAEVKDPGSSDHVHGDLALRTVLDEHNRSLPAGHRPVAYRPLIKGAPFMALDQHEDWMARLNFQRLRDTVLEGTARGWKTNLHGNNPIPAYVVGATFGQGTPKKPYLY